MRTIGQVQIHKDLAGCCAVRYVAFAVTAVVAFLLNSGQARAQFLDISPGARSTGMGEAFVALVDPASAHINPGAMGVFALDHVASYGRSSADWLPHWDLNLEMVYSHYFVGYNLKRSVSGLPYELAVGLDYHRQLFFDPGDSPWTDEEGNIIGTGSSWEKNDAIGASFGFRYVVEAGIGVSFNNISYNFPTYAGGESWAQGRDWGWLVRLPLNEAINRIWDFNIDNHTGPVHLNFTPSLGYSRNNVLNYRPLLASRDDLREISRNGYALDLTADLDSLRLFQFIYAREAAEHKIYWGSGVISSDGLGYEINLLDTYQYRWGHYGEPDYYVVSRKTSGYTLQTRGLNRLVYQMFLRKEFPENTLLGIMVKNLNLKYTRSEWNADDPESAIDNTVWTEFGISF